MPALPNVAKVIRVDLGQSVGANARVLDRIFFAYGGAGPTIADLNTLATTISNAWGTNLAPQVVAASALTSVKITDLNSNIGNQVIASVNKPGTVTGNQVLNGTAAVIRFKIARRYRGGHPRFYLAGLPSGDTVSGNQLLASYAAGLATAFANFIAACEATPPTSIGAMTHVNVSYFLGFSNKTFPSGRTRPVPTLRGTPVQDTVLSYSVNGLIGSQRRRNLQSA